jgi:hypothetical protein
MLKHFQEKWNPVFRPKMRPCQRAFSGEVESGLGAAAKRLTRHGKSDHPGN